MRTVLDLCCGPGGASAGYERAGYKPSGVDIVKQPNYPYPFHHIDARDISIDFIRRFDLVHASPPCQAHSVMRHATRRIYDDIIHDIRRLLLVAGVPYVIENVPTAPLIDPITLCGQMFNVRVIRHRIFETSFSVPQPEHVEHTNYVPFAASSLDVHNAETEYRIAMGIHWATAKEARQCIPPAYTRYIGQFAPGYEWRMSK